MEAGLPLTHHPLWESIWRNATEYESRLKIALARAREVPDDMVARTSVAALVDAIVDECAAASVTVDHVGLWVETLELPSHGREEPLVELNLCVMVDGASSALSSRGVLSGANSEGDEPAKCYLMIAQATNEEVADAMADTVRFGQVIEEFQQSLREAAAAANDEIQHHRADMRAQVMATVGARARRVRAVLAATDALGIPVAPRSTEQRIPLQTRRVTVAQLDAAVAAGTQEWHLAEQIAEDITATIMSFTAALERLVRSASKLLREDEETIRDFLLFILNANYQGAATGETFLGDGKTDILLRWRDRDAFIGECKIWHGPAKFAEAVDQLLGYTVWRDTRVALILFIRDRVDTSAVINRAGACLAQHPRLLQAITPDEPTRRRDYLLHAGGDQKRVIRLSLLPVVLPQAS
ncbi:hypothetical protein C1I95_25225 [Micromonospora craterilacus]|uniref:Uncharacterized protein n=1 Tax=Micromonospora craterilacus TaxID=1655439 RepID=A0A2W2E695_9ACTN|nr:hypothetical protein [Micromonospora craterilacus]PZG12735.1 hypothetical protein C1I95_25225 [Micromonospora craterilacus]